MEYGSQIGVGELAILLRQRVEVAEQLHAACCYLLRGGVSVQERGGIEALLLQGVGAGCDSLRCKNSSEQCARGAARSLIAAFAIQVRFEGG